MFACTSGEFVLLSSHDRHDCGWTGKQTDRQTYCGTDKGEGNMFSYTTITITTTTTMITTTNPPPPSDSGKIVPNLFHVGRSSHQQHHKNVLLGMDGWTGTEHNLSSLLMARHNIYFIVPAPARLLLLWMKNYHWHPLIKYNHRRWGGGGGGGWGRIFLISIHWVQREWGLTQPLAWQVAGRSMQGQ